MIEINAIYDCINRINHISILLQLHVRKAQNENVQKCESDDFQNWKSEKSPKMVNFHIDFISMKWTGKALFVVFVVQFLRENYPIQKQLHTLS